MPRLRRALAGVLVFVCGIGAASGQVLLRVQPGVQLSWLTNTNDTYRLQWSSNAPGPWTDLVSVAGNGATNTTFDPIPSGARLYQLLDVVPGTAAVSGNFAANGGFENGSGGTASNWTVDTAAGGPVIRDPHERQPAQRLV